MSDPRPAPAWFPWAVAALAAAVYAPAITASFHFDDYALFSDPAVFSPDGPLRLLAWERTRPLTYLTFWANYQIGGTDPIGYHLFNIAAHAFAAGLAASLFLRVAGPAAGVFAGVVFALHPLQTEAVAYVFGRATVLAASLAVAAWRAWDRERYWTTCGWFCAAMLAKEEAAAFPVFLAGYGWFVRGWRGVAWRRVRAPLAIMLAAVGVFAGRLLYAAWATPESGALFDLGDINPWTYLLTQGKVVWLYLRLLAAPFGLNFDRDVALADASDAVALLGWAALLAAAAGCLRLARRRPAFYWPLGGWILLSVSSSIAPLADLAVERRMYLPLLSFSLAIGAAGAAVLPRKVGWISVGILAAGLGGLTDQRAAVWRTEETLWRDAVRKSPEKVRPKLQLARALEAPGMAAAAERRALLEAARKREPRNPDVHAEFGVFHLQGNRPQQAEAAFERALAIRPDDPQLLANSGSAVLLAGRTAAAADRFSRALELDPCNFDARNNLLFVERRRGRLRAARRLADPPADCAFSPPQARALAAARERLGY